MSCIATYTVLINNTILIGPTSFAHGFEFAREEFTTCSCFCELDCLPLHRSCCVSESQCGQCLPGFYSNDEEKCERLGIFHAPFVLCCILFSLPFCLPSPLYPFYLSNQFVLLIIFFYVVMLAPEAKAWQMVFNETKGREWDDCNSESAYSDPCIYCGRVNCERREDHYVITDLMLSGLKIHGSIPSSIFQLQNLYGLDLSTNYLTGTISAEINQLNKLKALSLFANQLNGSIPIELYQLTNLQIIVLEINELIGTIDPSIRNLRNLHTISLMFNQLFGSIPREIGYLSNLEIIYIQDTEISGSIPPEIGNMSSLRELFLARNKLSGTIPPELSNLLLLEELALNENYLSGVIPTGLSSLQRLKYLSLYSNLLTGTVPEEIFECTKLKALLLHSNMLNGSLPVIVNHKNLEIFSVHSNSVSGAIPHMANLTNLRTLELQVNLLSGTVSSELSHLSNLSRLDLSFNKLTGTLSSKWESLSSLRVLNIHHNYFNGSIPLFLGTLKNLQILDISYNQFSGSLPYEWDDFNSFWVYRNVKNNDVSPYFVSLHQFIANNNMLSNDLRNFLSPFVHVKSLIQLDLSSNEITGSFDFELWSGLWYQFNINSSPQDGMSFLSFLDLSSNRIEGSLPSSLPSMLSIFFISNNKLGGSIPDSFSQLFVFLSKNNLMRGDELPSIFRPILNSYIDLVDYMSNETVECLQIQTINNYVKVFDIQPVYDHFKRCQCKAGHFNFQSGHSLHKPFVKCDLAPLGYFTSTRNRFMHPTPCPIGYFSDKLASTRCDICTHNTFSLGAQSRCHLCPAKAQCVDGVISLKQDTWIHPMRVLNESIKDEHIYDCLNNEACVVSGLNVTCS